MSEHNVPILQLMRVENQYQNKPYGQYLQSPDMRGDSTYSESDKNLQTDYGRSELANRH